MTIESRILTLENEREINSLLVRYCELVDSGKSDLIAHEFYTEDVQADYHFTILNGRSEIHEFYVSGMAGFTETAHSVSNVVIRFCSDDVAEVSSMLVAFHWHGERDGQRQDSLADFGLVVRSEDLFKRTPDGWRVAKRHARALGPSFALDATGPILRRKD